jgi:hypothetical protein
MFNKKLTSNLKAIDIIDSDLLSEAIFDGKEKTSLQVQQNTQPEKYCLTTGFCQGRRESEFA